MQSSIHPPQRAIVFMDTEVTMNGKVHDMGAIRADGSTFHRGSVAAFQEFVKGADFVCGHNILNHDLRYIGTSLQHAGLNLANATRKVHRGASV